MFRKPLLIVCLSLALALSPRLEAQYDRDGNISMGKLGEMEDLLSRAARAQKLNLLTRMGIDVAIGKIVIDELLPGQKIELHPFNSSANAQYGVAYLPSFRGCYLYLLQQQSADAKKPQWRVTGQEMVDCWDGAATLEILSLRSASQDDVVLHHVNEDHGSNILVDRTQVFSFIDGELTKTLETEDRRREDIIGDGNPTVGETVERESTFLLFPDRSYEETRTTTENYVLKTVERRYWRWFAGKGQFEATPFTVIAAPNR